VIATASLAGCVEDPAPENEQALSCDIPSSTLYVVDDVRMPLDGTQVEQYGFDQDGDGTVDNNAGNVFSAISMALGDGPTAAWREQLDARLVYSLGMVLQVERCDGGEQRVTLIGGEAPLGAIFDFVGGADEGWYPVDDLRIEIAEDGSGLTGKIGGTLAPGYEDTFADTLLPLVQSLRDSADEDMSSIGETFDENRDGTVTMAELRASSLFQTLMYADVDTDGDDTADAMSIGIAFHAAEL
jgi:hypothetical protein